MKAAYTEIAFWLTTLAGVGGIVTESLTSYPGDVVGQDVLVVAGIGIAVLNFVAAAMLRRIST